MPLRNLRRALIGTVALTLLVIGLYHLATEGWTSGIIELVCTGMLAVAIFLP